PSALFVDPGGQGRNGGHQLPHPIAQTVTAADRIGAAGAPIGIGRANFRKNAFYPALTSGITPVISLLCMPIFRRKLTRCTCAVARAPHSSANSAASPFCHKG